jgi:hypothetical protein
MKPASPQLGETPSAGVLERFEKCPVVATRHAVKRSLACSSSEVGEGPRASDAAVNIKNEIEENGCSPEPPAAPTLHASALSIPFSRPVSALSSPQSSNGSESTPPANDIERSEERSDAINGPAVE